MSVVEGIQENQIFGAREVMQLASCSSTSATALIKKMVALELVEKVTGHGNGKYRWKGCGNVSRKVVFKTLR